MAANFDGTNFLKWLTGVGGFTIPAGILAPPFTAMFRTRCPAIDLDYHSLWVGDDDAASGSGNYWSIFTPHSNFFKECTLRGIATGGGTMASDGFGAMVNGTWHHFCFRARIVDGAYEWHGHINGQLVVGFDYVLDPDLCVHVTAPMDAVRVGARRHLADDFDSPLKGAVDDLCIWTDFLDPSFITKGHGGQFHGSMERDKIGFCARMLTGPPWVSEIPTGTATESGPAPNPVTVLAPPFVTELLLGGVTPDSETEIITGKAGEDLDEGMVVRLTGGTLFRAFADTAANATIEGIILNGAKIGQPVQYVKRGLVDIGTAITGVGHPIGLSSFAPGGVHLYDDIPAAAVQSLLGYVRAGTEIHVDVVNTGVAKVTGTGSELALGTITPDSKAPKRRGIAGGAITAGQIIRLSGSTYITAQADTAANALAAGIALHDAALNDPIGFVDRGIINNTTAQTAGQAIVLSDAVAGGILLATDLPTTSILTLLGYTRTGGTSLMIDVQPTGIAKVAA